MSQLAISSRNPQTEGIALPAGRQPAGPDIGLPADVTLISADSHWVAKEDLFYERFPAHLKDKAPRIWFDQYWNLGFDGKSIFPTEYAEAQKPTEDIPGGGDVDARLADILAEGVQKEILFPQHIMALIRLPDLEVRSWTFRAYNQYLADVCARRPAHFYGVGIPNFWDPALAPASVREALDLGMRALMIPVSPGKDPNGEEVNYSSLYMDPLWAAAEEAGLPVCFHIGENVKLHGPGQVGASLLHNFGPLRESMGNVMFGGNPRPPSQSEDCLHRGRDQLDSGGAPGRGEYHRLLS